METIEVTITKIIQHAPGIVSLSFIPQSGGSFSYVAGQYISVLIDGGSVAEGKAYSLASAPYEAELRIVVKDIGEYSHWLCGRKVGDAMKISPAYGDFNPQTTNSLVCLAGGVGISPIYSVIKQTLIDDPKRQVQFYHSNPTEESIVAKDELSALGSQYDLTVKYHITRQAEAPDWAATSRIDLDEVMANAPMNAAYLICGSVGFVHDMRQGLIERGAEPRAISTEVFFEWQ